MSYQCNLLDKWYKVIIFIKRLFAKYLYLIGTFLVKIK